MGEPLKRRIPDPGLCPACQRNKKTISCKTVGCDVQMCSEECMAFHMCNAKLAKRVREKFAVKKG